MTHVIAPKRYSVELFSSIFLCIKQLWSKSGRKVVELIDNIFIFVYNIIR